MCKRGRDPMYLWTNDYLESAINEGSQNVEGWEYRERKKNNVFKELRVRALTMKLRISSPILMKAA